MRSFGVFSLDTIQNGLGYFPVPITPTNTGPFSLGSWNGNVTVLAAATNVFLTANDGAGHTGASNPFSVIYSNQPPLIFSQPTDQSLPSGYTATFTLNADGSQPLSYFWSAERILHSGSHQSKLYYQQCSVGGFRQPVQLHGE